MAETTDPVLVVNQLSKKFRRQNRAGADNHGGNPVDFFALKDVSFTVNRGDVVGLIGRNGAGKSTLLKILSEIISPSGGYVDYSGRISSILDIGAGFHPDLSGYENISLAYMLNGMPKEKRKERTKEIVAFSGLDDIVLKQPVKSYSNGMYLRLAFSIVFHNNFDILILDEVLSVGDALFRLQCLNKIKEISKGGATIIIASHDIVAIRPICNKCLLMDNGEIVGQGDTKTVIEQYYDGVYADMISGETKAGQQLDEHPLFEFHEVSIIPGGDTDHIYMKDDIKITITYTQKTDQTLDVVLYIHDYDYTILTDCDMYRESYVNQSRPAGKYQITCILPGYLFNAGTYYLGLIFGDKDSSIKDLPFLQQFKVELDEWEKDKKWNEGELNFPFRPRLNWEIKKAE